MNSTNLISAENIQTESRENLIPESIVESPTVMIFERRLDKYWHDHETKYSLKQSTVVTQLIISYTTRIHG